ncbi:MAG: endonuclease/exonuclease/phosphatase family protein [Bacteroidota bacterium]
MKTANKRIGFRIFIFLYLGLFLTTIGGGIAPFLPVTFLSFIQLIPAAFPLLFVLHLLFLMYFMRKSLRWGVLTTTGLAICVWGLSKDVRFKQASPEKQTEDVLRIVSFNVGTFDYDPKIIDQSASLINELNPDIVTLQEFRNHRLDDGSLAMDYVAQALGMDHYEFVHLPVHIHGAATYSKFPILDLDTLFMPQKEINSGILSTIQTPIGKIGVANLHLSSFHVAQTLDQNKGLKNRSRAMYLNTSEVLKLQQEKVDLTLNKVKLYPHPLILTGDLNAPSHSRITVQFADYFQDSFQAAGNGSGWTFPILGPVGMRIDYQFSSEELEVVRHEVIRSAVSDHYPVLVEYTLNP